MSAASDRLAAITAASFANGAHRTAFPAVCNDTATVSQEIAANAAAADADRIAADLSAAQAGASVTAATAQATAASASRAQAQAAVAAVTVGSTDSLAYPEQVRNLITAAEVVDVIVYDTRLDSDGGAWTERCTGASWFNEALNTATRGAKRAFPKVALIVAQQLTITIYDALDLDPATSTPRMWMVFQRITTDATMLRMSGNINGIAARNGQLARTVTDSGRALVVIDFIEDAAILAATGSVTRRRIGIADRNVSNSALWVLSSGMPNVATPTSVDMAVLPGAPINPVTGLPMPTILLGETAAFRVLHPTGPGAGRVSAVTLTGGYTRARFTADGRIVALQATAPTNADVGPVPYATSTANTSWRTHRFGSSGIGVTGGIILPTPGGVGTLVDLALGAIAQTPQVNIIAEDLGNIPNSMVASIGPDFATGWMPSTGMQLAALGEGVTGNITGGMIPDRSYRQTDINVVGTLSRAVVATDAEIAAFAGFSASNYLTQPSNAALAVTTGDVSFIGWANVSSFAAAFPIAAAQGTDGLELGVGTGGFNFRLQSATAGTNLTVTGNTTTTGQWAFVVGLRRAGVLEIWVNGQREATLAAAGTLTNTPGALEVGRSANASALSGLALLRIAAYAPTPAQIQRMFRDERPLFAAGGKAFLGGAPSATVRQLSRSRFTGRLGVAMSDGLTILDGLARVERQTTGTLGPAMASNSVLAVAMEAGITLIGTAANAGVRRGAIIGLDVMPQNAPTPQVPRIFRAQGVTVDATPLILAPRVFIRERETVVVRALITARVYGATDTESITYERRATYFRNEGGNVTIRGSVQTIGTDVEVTGTADATLVIDTTAQTVAAQVTGIAATRLVWSARFMIERNTQDSSYEEVI